METDPRLVEILRDTIVCMVRQGEHVAPDLSARQLAVLLICCLDGTPDMVSELRDKLNIPKAAIARTTNRLVQLGLLARENDARDRRRVLLSATVSGHAFVRELGTKMKAAAEHELPAKALVATG